MYTAAIRDVDIAVVDCRRYNTASLQAYLLHSSHVILSLLLYSQK